ncbi:MAG: adenosylcobinamide-GDP ribazoletransferase [Epulopiscium sp.]|nr:adenosylcobinamide-GDP ribazoletransferase [Candidatus Epulonipiscium sp.]
MKNIIKDFLLMVQFFTRFPIKINLPASPKNFRRGVVFLPLIGFIIGTCQYMLVRSLYALLPSSLLAGIAVILPIIITGALHIDGLGDSFDGFFAFTSDKDRRLEIMQDSSSGTFALCAIVSNILLQYLAIEYIIGQNKLNILLVVIMFSKIFVLYTAMWGRPAKSKGSGNIFIGNMNIIIVIVATIYSLIIAHIAIGLYPSLILLFAGGFVSFLFYLLSYKKIRGITGDTMGAIQELTTLVMLIVYCAII